jgi:hypothetical protein
VVAARLGMRVRTGWATVGAASLVTPEHAQIHGLRAAGASVAARMIPRLFNGVSQANPTIL